jgi:hypothetical protein
LNDKCGDIVNDNNSVRIYMEGDPLMHAGAMLSRCHVRPLYVGPYFRDPTLGYRTPEDPCSLGYMLRNMWWRKELELACEVDAEELN